MKTELKLNLNDLKNEAEVLNSLSDDNLLEVISELERLMNFSAPNWDKNIISKREYVGAVFLSLKTAMSPMNLSDAKIKADELINVVKNNDPGLWRKIVSKLRIMVNPLNLLTRKN